MVTGQHAYAPSEMAASGQALPDVSDRRRMLWSLVSLTIIGALLRMSTITSRGLWQDEAAQISQLTGTVLDTIQSQIGGTHPPLFHVLMHFWIQAFGTSEVALRSFSVLVGVASIPLAYWAGATLYNRAVGLLAAGILALSPYHIWYSQEARMYSLMMFFGLLSLTCFVNAMRENTPAWWAVYFLVTLPGLFTQYFFLLLLGGQWLYYLFVEILQREIRLGRAGLRQAGWRTPRGLFGDVPTLAPWLVTNGLLIGCTLLWMYQAVFFTPSGPSSMVSSLSSTGLGYGAPGPSLALRFNDIGITLVEVLTGFHPPWLVFGLVAMWPLIIYFMMLLLGYGREVRTQTVFLLFSLISGTLVIWTLGQWQGVVLLSRYLMGMASAGVLIGAVAIDLIPPGIRRPLLVIAVVLAVASWTNQSFDPMAMGRYQNREAVAYVAERVQPGDAIIYQPFYIDRITEYYLPDELTAYGLPMYSSRNGFRDQPALIRQDLDRVVGPSSQVWVILGFQNVKDILATTRVMEEWFAENGYTLVEDKRLNKVRVLRYEGDGSRDALFEPDGEQ